MKKLAYNKEILIIKIEKKNLKQQRTKTEFIVK